MSKIVINSNSDVTLSKKFLNITEVVMNSGNKLILNELSSLPEGVKFSNVSTNYSVSFNSGLQGPVYLLMEDASVVIGAVNGDTN